MSLQGIPSFFVSYTEKDEKGEEQISKGLGEMLNDCTRYPHTLALVAKETANIIQRSERNNLKYKQSDFDSCVWTAKLITKYVESVHRIRSPPCWPPSEVTDIEGTRIVFSKL